MIIRRVRRLLLRTFLATAVIGGVLFATISADAATIRQQTVVDGDQVTLGDLFDGLDMEMAEKAVSPAPAPGRRAVYDYRTLGRLARAYRVNWQAGTTLDRVIIERSATTLSGEVIESHLIQELAQDMAVTPEELSVTLDNRSTSVALPIDAAPTLAIRRMVHDPISGRFTATIVAPAEGPTLYEATLTGRTVPIISLPVLAAPLRNGDVIKDRDLITLKVPAERVNGTVIIDREDLIGMTPRRSVSANTPIRDADIHAPIVVERGTPVTIRLNHGAIALTAKGRAMDDAARGDILRVMNVASNRIVDAIAIGPNAVQVTLP